MNAEQANILANRQQIEEIRPTRQTAKPMSAFDRSVFDLKEAIKTATEILDQSPIPDRHVNRLSLRLDELTASLKRSVEDYKDGQIAGRTLIQITKQTAGEMKQIEEMLFQY